MDCAFFIEPHFCYCNTTCIYVILNQYGLSSFNHSFDYCTILSGPQLSPSMIFPYSLGSQIRETVVASRPQFLLLFAIYLLSFGPSLSLTSTSGQATQPH